MRSTRRFVVFLVALSLASFGAAGIAGAHGDEDHPKTEMDHSQGEMDHSQGEMDHSKTEMDHSQGEMDHSKTEMDHSQGEMDHGKGTAEGPKAKAAKAKAKKAKAKLAKKCAKKKYAKNHKKACKKIKKGQNGGNTALAKPLAVTADGLIDATKVNLGGVAGLSKADQRASEQLLVDTIEVLPKWSDVEQAKADGFQSIGDGLTGEEHFLHWDWIDDDVIFDPNQPESLVYKVDRRTGQRTLEAAMFILPKEYNLQNEHEIASPILQFHIHDNLCFTPPPAPQVRGLTRPDGTCGTFGTTQLVKFNPNPMVHVWIRPNECGPFAALQGVGAGQTANGERACDHQHGRLTL